MSWLRRGDVCPRNYISFFAILHCHGNTMRIVLMCCADWSPHLHTSKLLRTSKAKYDHVMLLSGYGTRHARRLRGAYGSRQGGTRQLKAAYMTATTAFDGVWKYSSSFYFLRMTGPRRSQRLQAGRPSTAETDLISIKPKVERDSEVTETPKSKKRKIAHEKKNTRKKTGQLQSMLDMPLDIILEVSHPVILQKLQLYTGSATSCIFL